MDVTGCKPSLSLVMRRHSPLNSFDAHDLACFAMHSNSQAAADLPSGLHARVFCRGSGGSRISFQDIHGGNTAVIRAADLQLERFLSEEDLRSARSATSAAQLPAQPEVALLTGANGFLGRFLLLELLQTVSKQ